MVATYIAIAKPLSTQEVGNHIKYMELRPKLNIIRHVDPVEGNKNLVRAPSKMKGTGPQGKGRGGEGVENGIYSQLFPTNFTIVCVCVRVCVCVCLPLPTNYSHACTHEHERTSERANEHTLDSESKGARGRV